jgi:hypothetical protein
MMKVAITASYFSYWPLQNPSAAKGTKTNVPFAYIFFNAGFNAASSSFLYYAAIPTVVSCPRTTILGL